jgi:hypothetical protein
MGVKIVVFTPIIHFQAHRASKSMKKKGTPGRKNSAGDLSILCPACGNIEFKRSLWEKDSVVRLSFKARGLGVIETVIREGNIQFIYKCAKCGAPLVQTPARSEK